eukprot:2248087-Alexandrium_andersonii.AAC.1
MYVAQLAVPSDEARKQVRLTVQRVTGLPMNSVTVGALANLKALQMPAQFRDFEASARAARYRTVRTSGR